MHAVYSIGHRETMCGRRWREHPEMRVETAWQRVTCKRCRAEVTSREFLEAELEAALHDLQIGVTDGVTTGGSNT